MPVNSNYNDKPPEIPVNTMEEKPYRRKKSHKSRHLVQENVSEETNDDYLQQDVDSFYLKDQGSDVNILNNSYNIKADETFDGNKDKRRRRRRDKMDDIQRQRRLPRMSSDPGDLRIIKDSIEDNSLYSNPDELEFPNRPIGYKQVPSQDVMKEAKVNFASTIESRLSEEIKVRRRRNKSRSPEGSEADQSREGKPGAGRRQRKAKSVTFYGTV